MHCGTLILCPCCRLSSVHSTVRPGGSQRTLNLPKNSPDTTEEHGATSHQSHSGPTVASHQSHSGPTPSFRVPVMVQADRWRLRSTGTQVRSPARHSGFRIQHCHSCSLGYNCGSDLIPGQGTPYALGQPKKRGGKYCKKTQSFSFHCGF